MAAAADTRRIPVAVIAVVSEALAGWFSHAALNSIFALAGAPGPERKDVNKVEKCREWLYRANKQGVSDPLLVLGSALERYSPTLTLPKPQDLGGLWAVVKKDLKLEAGDIADADVRTILGGLASVVSGIGALRTHTGSAHGKGGGRFRSGRATPDSPLAPRTRW